MGVVARTAVARAMREGGAIVNPRAACAVHAPPPHSLLRRPHLPAPQLTPSTPWVPPLPSWVPAFLPRCSGCRSRSAPPQRPHRRPSTALLPSSPSHLPSSASPSLPAPTPLLIPTRRWHAATAQWRCCSTRTSATCRRRPRRATHARPPRTRTGAPWPAGACLTPGAGAAAQAKDAFQRVEAAKRMLEDKLPKPKQPRAPTGMKKP